MKAYQWNCLEKELSKNPQKDGFIQKKVQIKIGTEAM